MDKTKFLPGLLGPVELRQAGKVIIAPRLALNFKGNVKLTDNPTDNALDIEMTDPSADSATTTVDTDFSEGTTTTATPLIIGSTFEIPTNSLVTVDVEVRATQAGAFKSKTFSIRRVFHNKGDVITDSAQTDLLTPLVLPSGTLAASVAITRTGKVGRVEGTGVQGLKIGWRVSRQVETQLAPAAPPAPNPTGVSPGAGNNAGDTAVTVSGTGFVNGAGLEVYFDDVIATSIVWVSATSITCVTPPGPAGAVNVKVKNPDTQEGTLVGGYTYTAYDPAALPLTVWLPGSFISSPWVGAASAGSSGGRNFAEGSNPPTSGTAVDGYHPATFNGTTQQLSNATPISTTLTNGGYRRMLLAKCTSISTAFSLALFGTNDAAVSDTGGYAAIAFTTSGGNKVQCAHYQTTGKGTDHVITLGSYFLVCMRFDLAGTKIRSRLVQGGVISAIAEATSVGNPDLLTGTCLMGKNYNASARFTGSILDHIDLPGGGTDAWFDDMLSYARGRYPSAGL